jgi:hypothetical protein
MPGWFAAMTKTLLLCVPDLMFAAQIEHTAKASGYVPRDLRRHEPLGAQIKDAVLLVLQLTRAREAWLPMIAAAKAAGVPVLAFGAHVDAETLRAARAAGADRAVPNSQLATELPALIASLGNQ